VETVYGIGNMRTVETVYGIGKQCTVETAAIGKQETVCTAIRQTGPGKPGNREQ
jgi:hypothetical protein